MALSPAAAAAAVDIGVEADIPLPAAHPAAATGGRAGVLLAVLRRVSDGRVAEAPVCKRTMPRMALASSHSPWAARSARLPR